MSLSKKNLDKLNKFKKKKNLNNESKNINNYANTTINDKFRHSFFILINSISNPKFLYFADSINC